MVVSDKPQRQPIAHPAGEEGFQNNSSWRQNIYSESEVDASGSAASERGCKMTSVLGTVALVI